MNRKSTILLMVICVLMLFSVGIKAQNIIELGTETSSNYYYSNPSPYGNYATSNREQYLIKASELQALGFTGGHITSLGFNVQNPSGSSLNQLGIKIGTTTDTNLYTFQNNLIQVVFPATYTDTYGWNIHNFTNSFYWDGISNLVVEVCFTNTYSYQNAVVYNSTTNYVSSLFTSTYNGSACNFNSGNYSFSRPNMKIGYLNKVQYDGGITAITSPTFMSEPGNYPLKVRLTNFGTSVLNSININWSVDTYTGTPYSWTGNLASGSSIEVTLSTSQSFTTGTHTIKAWTSSPNNNGDGIPQNDMASNTITFKNKLNGTYTIGGTGSDFPSFTEAYKAMEYGVSGPVIFNVADGVYNEQLIIDSIQGTSATNIVTFQSASGIAENVKLQFYSDYMNNYVVKFKNVHYLQFKKLKIEALNNYSGNVLVFENNCSNITVTDNIIQAPETSYGSTANIYANYSGSSYNTIKNNKIYGGNYGIQWNGSNEYGNVFKNNLIRDFSQSGISVSYLNTLEISGNEITTPSSKMAYYTYGINVNYNSQEKIFNNTIYFENYSNHNIYGISHYNNYNYSSLIYNNFVTINNPYSLSYGIFSNSMGSQTSIVFNTINLYGNSDSSNYALYCDGYGTIKNNIICNKAGGFVLYAYNLDSVDYNNYFSNSQKILKDNDQIIYATVSELKSETNSNLHSVSSEPVFFSNTNLHTYNLASYHSGTPITGISTDIDGQSRHATTPNMGADEYTLYNLDAGVEDIVGPENPCAGTFAVTVRVRNYGLQALNSVTLKWYINGSLQNSVPISTTIPAGGYIDVIAGNMTATTAGKYDMLFYTVNPNGSTDGNNSNDTLSMEDAQVGISGTFTVGGSGADYLSIENAIYDIENRSICGPVVFNILPGTYTGNYTIHQNYKSTAINNITFQSSTGNPADVIFKMSSSDASQNYIFKLDETDNFTFRNLSFQTTASYSVCGILLNGECSNINISGNVFSNSLNASNYVSGIEIRDNSKTHNLRIKSNTFNGGTHAIRFGYSYQGNAKNILIDSNQITNFTQYGILIYNVDSSFISNNSINTTLDKNYTMGININNSYGVVVNNNRIILSGNQQQTGIRLYNMNFYNQVRNSIYNNFINVNNLQSYSDGITLDQVDAYDIYYNSIRNSSQIAGSTISIYGNGYGTTNNYLKNNIIESRNASKCINFSNSGTLQMDYNNYYFTGNSLIGYIGDEWFSDLNSLKSSYSTQNQHSVQVNPFFQNSNTPDIQNPALNGSATFINSILKDINGITRNTTNPDMGALEFTPPAHDLSVIKVSDLTEYLDLGVNYPVKVLVANMGTNSESNFNVKYSLNGNTYTMLFSGTLAPGKDTLIEFSQNIYFSTFAQTTFKAFTDLSSDLKRGNDTLSLQIIACAPLSGTYTIGSSEPIFKTINEAALILHHCGMSGNVELKIKSGTYNEKIWLSEIDGFNDTAQTLRITSFAGQSDSVIISSSDASGNPVVIGFGYLGGKVVLDNITVQNNMISESGGIYLNDWVGSFRIENCKVESNNNNNQYGIIVSGDENNVQINNVYILNNKLNNGKFGIVYQGNYDYTNRNINITGNTINSFDSVGIVATSIAHVNIQGNTISSAKSTNGLVGIAIEELSDSPQIIGNKISLNSSKSVVGLAMRYSSGGINVKMEGAQNHPGSTSSAYALVSNNFITTKSNASQAFGISIIECNEVDFYHNSVNTLSSTFGLSIDAIYCNNLSFYNNNLANQAKGFVIRSNSTGGIYSNYNNLYALSDTLASMNYITLLNLNQLRTYSQSDMNSKSVIPQFKSETDLHCTSVALNNAGMPNTLVLNDIDNEIRSTTTPDIGADEFIPKFERDASVADIQKYTDCFGPANFKVKVVNDGLTNITALKLWWHDEVGYQDTLDFTLNLKPDSTIMLDLATNYNAQITTQKYKVYVLQVNNLSDMNQANDSVNKILNFFPTPVIYMSGLDTQYCSNSPVDNFSIAPSGGTFIGPGITSTTFNPQIAGIGTHKIFYNVSNIYGCTAKDSFNVKVVAAPTVNFSITNNFCNNENNLLLSGVSPANGIFSGTAITAGGYFSPSVAGSGNHILHYTFTDSNMCSNSDTALAIVKVQPTSDFSAPSTICFGDTLDLNYTGSGSTTATYNWNFNGGNIVSGSNQGPYEILFANSGLKIISLQLTENGCTSAITNKFVYVNPISAAIYTTSGTNFCQGDSLLIIGSQAYGNSYQWYKDNTILTNDTLSFLYIKNPGIYHLVVNNINGCSAKSSGITINMINKPSSTFTVTSSVCMTDTVNISYTGNGSVAGIYNWNFGGASILSGTGKGPYQIKFNTGGSKNISLQLSDAGCQSVITSQTIAVHELLSNIYVTGDSSYCSSDSLLINGTPNTGATYSWTKDNVVLTSAQNPYVYASGSGVYQMKVSDSFGCSLLSNPKTITKKTTPNANYTINSAACSTDTITVSYTGNASGTATYNWSFGDATIISGSGQGPYTLRFPTGGSKTTNLKVIDNACPSPTNYNVTQVTDLVSSIYVNNDSTFCSGDSLLISGSIGSNYSYQWYKNNSPIAGATLNKMYATTSGNYSMKVTHLSSGCSLMSNPIVVNMKNTPTSAYTIVPNACSTDTLTINYTGNASSTANYTWNFGDASIISGTGQGPYTIRFFTGGTKSSNLKVVENGCSSTTNYQNTLVTDLISSIYVNNDSTFCSGDSLLISGSIGSNYSYQWFKNNTPVSGSTLNKMYALNTGVYSMKVSHPSGCSLMSNPVSIIQKTTPTSSFTIPAAACSSDTITVSYTGNAGAGANYIWDFNGATIISGSNQGPYTVRYLIGGTRNPNLKVMELGCPSTITTNSISVQEVFSSIYVTGDSTFCDNDSLIITGSSSPGATYQWYRNDTLIPGATLTYFFAHQSGNYSMKTTNGIGCTSMSNTMPLTRKLKPTANFFVNPAACIEDTVLLIYQGNAPSNANYIWNVSGGNIIAGSGQGPVSVKYSTTGQKVISLNVNIAGCYASPVSQSVVINSTSAIATVVGSTTFCAGDSVSLFANTGPNLSYSWFNGQTELNGETNSFMIAKNTGSYKVKVLNTQTGCKAISNSIAVVSNSTDFNLAFTANQTNLTNPPFIVNFTNTTPAISNYNFAWSFGDAGTSTVISPSHQYIWDGNYTVALYAQNLSTGCADTLIKQNYIHCTGGNPNPCSLTATVNQGGSTVFCQGDSLLLTANVSGAQGPLSYTWFRNGVFMNQSSQSFYTLQNGQYIVVVADTLCNFTSLPLVVGYYPSVTPVIACNDTIQPCSNDSILLYVNNYFSGYQWSTGETSSSIYIKNSGNYYVSVTTSNGCHLVSSAYNVNASLLNPPSICIVGVDTANHNRVIWEKPNTGLIDSFYVYRETTVSNVYNKIGAVAYNAPGIFTDSTANPAVRAWRYRLSALDTCGMESPQSSIHKTMHLTINVGLNGAWNLIWDGYTGFNFGSYKIFRGTNANNMTYLAQIPSNISSYTDLNPPTGTIFYQVEIINPYGCYPDSNFAKANTNYNSSRSNTANTAMLAPVFLTADFTANATSGTWPIQIQFNDLSTGSPNSWKWNFGDGNVSVEQNPKHTYNNTGLYTIRLIACNNQVCDTIVKDDYINVLPNGIVEVFKETRLVVYPNPADDKVSVDIITKTNGEFNISLFNSIGQKLKSENIQTKTGLNTHQFDILNCAPGVYFIILSDAESHIVRRLIIK